MHPLIQASLAVASYMVVLHLTQEHPPRSAYARCESFFRVLVIILGLGCAFFLVAQWVASLF